MLSDLKNRLKRNVCDVDQQWLFRLRSAKLRLMPLLKVDRSHFIDSVQVLVGMTKRNRIAKAMLTFSNDVLSIKVGSTAIDVPASGDWSGIAKTHGQAFLLASRDLPATDTLTLKVEDDRLLIERRSISCEWTESKPPRARVTKG